MYINTTTAEIQTSEPTNKFAQPNGMSKITFDQVKVNYIWQGFSKYCYRGVLSSLEEEWQPCMSYICILPEFVNKTNQTLPKFNLFMKKLNQKIVRIFCDMKLGPVTYLDKKSKTT